MPRGRLQDPWKRKVTYTLQAPKCFNNEKLGTTVANDPTQLIGRKLSVDISELGGSKQKASVIFKIHKVVGTTAKVSFVGHKVPKEYVYAASRRGTRKIYVRHSVKTKDDKSLLLKTFAITRGKSNKRQTRAIAAKIQEIQEENAKKHDFDEFIQEILYGKLVKLLYTPLRKIYPIRQIVIEKSQT